MRRHDLTRHSRRALAWALSAFVTAQLLLTWALENGPPELRDPEYGRKLALLRQRLAESRPGRPLVLFLGSSRVGVGVRPSLVMDPSNTSPNAPLVFNFAICRAGPVMELLCLRRLLDEGIRPDLLLIEVWSPLMHDRGQLEADSIATRRLSFSDLARLSRYHRDRRSLFLSWLGERLVPTSTYATEWLRRSAPWLLGDRRQADLDWWGLDAWGWLDIPAFESLGPLPLWRRRTESVHRAYAGALTGPLALRADEDRPLHELLALCRERRIRAALLLMPDEFLAQYHPAVREGFETYLDELGRRYDAPVLDMRTWVESDGFYDGVHLTHAVADEFSARLRAWNLPQIGGTKAVAREAVSAPRR
ncbi:MAG TPA: hypothetical protein VMV69_12215 [Pirellulales bacterium]|nr:hypothetical protein [Pirellulales bacterium]